MAFPLVHPALHPGTFDKTVDLMVREKTKLLRVRVGYESVFRADFCVILGRSGGIAQHEFHHVVKYPLILLSFIFMVLCAASSARTLTNTCK